MEKMISNDTLTSLCDEFRKNNRIDAKQFEKYDVKRGLRNADGSGVMAGLTLICNVCFMALTSLSGRDVVLSFRC